MPRLSISILPLYFRRGSIISLWHAFADWDLQYTASQLLPAWQGLKANTMTMLAHRWPAHSWQLQTQTSQAIWSMTTADAATAQHNGAATQRRYPRGLPVCRSHCWYRTILQYHTPFSDCDCTQSSKAIWSVTIRSVTTADAATVTQ